MFLTSKKVLAIVYLTTLCFKLILHRLGWIRSTNQLLIYWVLLILTTAAVPVISYYKLFPYQLVVLFQIILIILQEITLFVMSKVLFIVDIYKYVFALYTRGGMLKFTWFMYIMHRTKRIKEDLPTSTYLRLSYFSYLPQFLAFWTHQEYGILYVDMIVIFMLMHMRCNTVRITYTQQVRSSYVPYHQWTCAMAFSLISVSVFLL